MNSEPRKKRDQPTDRVWHRVSYRRNCQLLLNRSVAMAMPARWTQCEEGAAASVSTSASCESKQRAEASWKKRSTHEELMNFKS